MPQDCLPIFTPCDAPLHRYWSARREAHQARRAGALANALSAENRAGALLDAAANADADCTTWATLIEACDEAATAPAFDPAAWNALIELPKPTRADLIVRVNKALGHEARTSPDACCTLREKGYDADEATTWGAWIVDNADEAGASLRTAVTLFDPDEAFDGFVTGLQDGGEGE